MNQIAKFFFSVGARREPKGWLSAVCTIYAAGLALWVIYAATLAVIDRLQIAAIFVPFMLVLLFLTVAPFPSSATERLSVFDYLLALASAACGVYFIAISDTMASRISLLDPLTELDLLFGTLFWLLTLEATRRAVGIGLTLIVVAFVVYNLWGHLLGGAMAHGYISYEHFLDQTVFTTFGIFGAPVRVAATYAFLFVAFGTFLQRAGGGEFFFNLAAALSGRSPGGPAKVAVSSSALFGTISGSPTSDVVTTGSVTIPLMQRIGFSASLAGAIEVAASAGGGILPPVMGSAAFIMVEITGIGYDEIVLAAIIPALLFYVGVYAQVHLRSVRLGISGMDDAEIPRLSEALRHGGVFAVPLLSIVVALLLGFSPTFVAVFGTMAVLVVAGLSAQTRIGPTALVKTLAEVTMHMVPVTAACAAAGLVVGGISMTGLSGKFAALILTVGEQSLFITLLLGAAVTILLGMGMPTPSAYIMAAVLVGPALVEAGINVLNAHMFLLFYASLSAITPPVAVAAYAASSIAGANPLVIAGQAVRLAFVAFVVPFMFAMDPRLLGQGTWPAVAWALVTAVAGVLALSSATEGYLKGPLPVWGRVLVAAGGLCLFLPGTVTDAIGAVLVLLGLSSALRAWSVARKRNPR